MMRSVLIHFFQRCQEANCQVGEIWIKGWWGGWWGGEGGWWHLIQSLHSRGDDFKVGTLSVTHWWSKSLCFLVQWCNNAGNGRVVLANSVWCMISWIIDALHPGSPMISDHLQYNMRSSTIWGQLKGQHLNQLEHSGWVKISKLAVLLSLNVINAIKQYCTRANWSGHKMRWSVDQIKTGHHNKDTDSWFKSVLICPTYTSPWVWI